MALTDEERLSVRTMARNLFTTEKIIQVIGEQRVRFQEQLDISELQILVLRDEVSQLRGQGHVPEEA